MCVLCVCVVCVVCEKERVCMLCVFLLKRESMCGVVCL